jgi:hypothetical protein
VTAAAAALSPLFVPMMRWALRIRPVELRLPADA